MALKSFLVPTVCLANSINVSLVVNVPSKSNIAIISLSISCG